VALVSLECSRHGIDINTLIRPQNMMLTYFQAQPAPKSTSPESTSSTIASTTAFVPTTSSMVTTTGPWTGPPTPFQSAAESSRTESEGLGAAVTGGLATSITIAGIAVIALIVWLVIRKGKRAAQTSDASTVLSSPSDNSEKKTNHHRHSHEPSHGCQETTHLP
jgi:hypothetical protein